MITNQESEALAKIARPALERGRNRTFNLLIKSLPMRPREMASKASEKKELTRIQPARKEKLPKLILLDLADRG